MYSVKEHSKGHKDDLRISEFCQKKVNIFMYLRIKINVKERFNETTSLKQNYRESRSGISLLYPTA